MSAKDDDKDVDRTLRLMRELAAVREKLADMQKRGSKPRVSVTTAPATNGGASRTSSLPASQRPPTK
jgi:hypothetical protein